VLAHPAQDEIVVLDQYVRLILSQRRKALVEGR
jgi:hypothetical protein